MTYVRRAFTMIELLIAIGVIIVLLGMLMYGLRGFSNSAKGRETRATLEIAMGLFSELDAKVRLAQSSDVRQYWVYNGSIQLRDLDAVPAADLSFWQSPLRTTTGNPAPIRAPAKVSSGETDRNEHEAIRNAAIAMSRFMALPANRSKVQSLPAQRLMRIPPAPPAGNGPNLDATAVHEDEFPILLDGWGNPIIFVPASGLGSVSGGGSLTLSGATDRRTITSTKIRNPAGVSSDFAIAGTDRPFFASAGPDGDFATGDDNIYSFEK